MNKEDLPTRFDWKYYVAIHKDLQHIKTETEAINHWLDYGHTESREYCGLNNLSLIVACKNRTDNLIKILPSWLQIERINQVIIVDYSSDTPISENLQIDNKKINLVRVEDKDKFNLGQAYNIAIDYCINSTILKIDADHLCVDSSFLDYCVNPYIQSFFMHGDHEFSNNGLSGFCMFPKKYNVYYREDLNGWGYDDLDFYQRLGQQPHPWKKNEKLKKVIFFDIERYVEHIEHKPQHDARCNKNNKLLCVTEPYLQPLRQNYNYNSSGNIVFDDKKTIDKTYCINLKHRSDRWAHVSSVHNVTRFDAIDTKLDTEKYKEYSLAYSPIDIEVKIYFEIHQGAYGAYLSHYLLWKKIVEEKLDYTLILEDDISPGSVNKVLDSNLMIKDYDLIQLSKRFRFDMYGNPIFDGAESYILSQKGALALIALTESPFLLQQLKVRKYNNPNYLNFINDSQHEWSVKPAITCPVDKFIGYVCQTEILKSYLYPSVDLSSVAEQSDISIKNHNAWNFSKNEIAHYAKLLS